jgi:hypothetical protein
VDAVGGKGRHRDEDGKQQYAVGAGISDTWKTLERLADAGSGADRCGSKIAGKFILHARGDFLQPLCSELWEHAASLQCSDELRG